MWPQIVWYQPCPCPWNKYWTIIRQCFFGLSLRLLIFRLVEVSKVIEPWQRERYETAGIITNNYKWKRNTFVISREVHRYIIRPNALKITTLPYLDRNKFVCVCMKSMHLENLSRNEITLFQKIRTIILINVYYCLTSCHRSERKLPPPAGHHGRPNNEQMKYYSIFI